MKVSFFVAGGRSDEEREKKGENLTLGPEGSHFLIFRSSRFAR